MAERTRVAPQRLSPFVLPTSTTTYFILLVTLTVGISAIGFAQVVVDRIVDVQPCVVQARSGDLGGPLAVTLGFLDCMQAVGRLRGLTAALTGGGVLLVLAALHYVTPAWEIRRYGLQPLDPAIHPAAARVIEGCLTEARLRARPSFLLEPAMKAGWGRAFGSYGRYHVKLSLGLVRMRTAEGEAHLRAIVRHELAHLVNRDLEVTGLSLQSVRVYLVAVAAPILVITIVRFPAYTLLMALRLAVVAVLILMIRAALLRSREHDADVRASAWAVAAGDDPFEVTAFAEPPTRSRVARLRRTHPPVNRRAAVVTQPAVLLRAGATEAFGAGIVVGAVLGLLTVSTGDILGNGVLGLLVLGLGLGALVVTTVGTGLWRATLRAVVDGARLPSGVAPGAALMAGLVVGDLVTPNADLPRAWTSFSVNPMLTLVAAAVCTVFVIGFCRWTVGSAAMWLPAARSTSLATTLRGNHVVGILACGSVLMIVTLGLGSVSTGLPFALALGFIGPTIFVPVQLGLLAALFSLFAAGLRGQAAGRRVWLEDPQMVALPAPRLRPNVVLVAVIIVFLGAVALQVLVLSDVVGAMSPTPAGTEHLVQLFLIALFGLHVIVFVVVALVADDLTGGTLAAAHGAVAAFFGGSAAATATMLVPSLRWCGTNPVLCRPEVIWRNAGVLFLANGSAALWCVFAIGPVIGVVGALRRVARRTAGGPVQPPTRGRRRGLAVGAVFTIAVVAPMVGYGLWFGLYPPGDGPVIVAPEVRDAPPAGPARSLASAAACASRGATSGNPFSALGPQQIAFVRNQNMLRSGDPALRSFGFLADEGFRTGRADLADYGTRAADSYCFIGNLVG